MKREELKAMGLTDEQVDAVMDANGKDVTNVRKKLDAANASVQTLTATVNEFEQQASKMKESSATAEEQYNAQLKEMSDRIAQMTVRTNRGEAASICASAGIPESQLDSILDVITTSDLDATKKAAEAIAALCKSRYEAGAEAKGAELIKSNPKPKGYSDSDAPAVTKEQFEAMSLSEQMKFFSEHPDLYEAYNG